MFPFGQSLLSCCPREKGGKRGEGGSSGTSLAYLKAGEILASEILVAVRNLQVYNPVIAMHAFARIHSHISCVEYK